MKKKAKFSAIALAAAMTLTALSLSLTGLPAVRAEAASSAETVDMYRLYNKNTGEHFYTASIGERNKLIAGGWNDEGIGWLAPKTSSTPVYRLYNPNSQDHHYTVNATEKDFLVKSGWKSEGIGWYSDDSKRVPLYRQYNPNAKTGNHNYTTNADENNFLVENGWKAEGISWYGAASGLEDTNLNTHTVDSQLAAAAGLFNTVTGSVPYKQNIFRRVYPASTTKVLTALVALKYGNLSQTITISENAVNQPADSSVADLRAGDRLTLRQLLYGLLLASGNDAAIAIAEGVSDDTDPFVALMNQEAKALGATQSNFINPNGLPDPNHYTTVYDMYLIMKAAIQYPDFVDVIHTASYDAHYTDAAGNAVTQTWQNKNQYINGSRQTPEGVEVIGGKTGTTEDAGYCLVLLSRNAAGQDIISLVYKADTRTNLYLLMGEILEAYSAA